MADYLSEGNAQSIGSNRIYEMLYRFDNLIVLDKGDIQRVEVVCGKSCAGDQGTC